MLGNYESTLTQSSAEAIPEHQEKANFFPEIYCNAPLESTTFVYSIPVRGEWNNGHLLRTLKALFSQHTRDRESVEIQIISNIGFGIENLIEYIDTGERYRVPKETSSGDLVLSSHGDSDEEKSMNFLYEANESNNYLKKIITVQGLVRELKNASSDKNKIQSEIENLVSSVTSPLEKDILLLAIQKSMAFNLMLVDASHTFFSNTEYRSANISSMRTLGIDTIKARYPQSQNIALSLFDADTIPQDNNVVFELQELYAQNPDLNYIFLGMENSIPGHSKNFIADSPRENIRRAGVYSLGSTNYGSPQISFRMSTYDKLKEISGWSWPGFHGDEDRDTALRLIYHFGNLQDELLLEKSASIYFPTVLTADRLDGFNDSKGRAESFNLFVMRPLLEDLSEVLSFREQMEKLIESRPTSERLPIQQLLLETKKHFLKKEQQMQRFNKLLLRTFIQAYEQGFIQLINEKAQINVEKIMELSGGTALSHYLEQNKNLVTSILKSPEDIEVIKHFLGLTKEVVEEPLTDFQMTLREYVGDVRYMDDLISSGELAIKREKGERDQTIWKTEDLRQINSSSSIMHSTIAEILALGQVYKLFFETDKSNLDRFELGHTTWPKNHDEQKLNYKYEDHDQRIKKIQSKMNWIKDDVSTEQKQKDAKWWEKIQFSTFPIFGLFKKLNR
ncbi:hypothetical protein KKI22_01415 [Patescibacteria group bacterium]|nr:hypothetical protein [Patescibacteria group bacterium]